MKTLLLFLFLGVSVALAELPFEDPALEEFSDVEDEEFLGELDDEENDPHHHRPGRSPPLFVKLCKAKLKICLRIRRTPCGKLRCFGAFRVCIKSHMPSPRPTLPFSPPPHAKLCRAAKYKCFKEAGRDCRKKLRCIFCGAICMKTGRPACGPRPTRG